MLILTRKKINESKFNLCLIFISFLALFSLIYDHKIDKDYFSARYRTFIFDLITRQGRFEQIANQTFLVA